MNGLSRLLSVGALRALPKNMMVPAVVLALGWYGGAKYGAPDALINSVDGAIAQGGDIIGSLLNGDGAPVDGS